MQRVTTIAAPAIPVSCWYFSCVSLSLTASNCAFLEFRTLTRTVMQAGGVDMVDGYAQYVGAGQSTGTSGTVSEPL